MKFWKENYWFSSVVGICICSLALGPQAFAEGQRAQRFKEYDNSSAFAHQLEEIEQLREFFEKRGYFDEQLGVKRFVRDTRKAVVEAKKNSLKVLQKFNDETAERLWNEVYVQALEQGNASALESWKVIDQYDLTNQEKLASVLNEFQIHRISAELSRNLGQVGSMQKYFDRFERSYWDRSVDLFLPLLPASISLVKWSKSERKKMHEQEYYDPWWVWVFPILPFALAIDAIIFLPTLAWNVIAGIIWIGSASGSTKNKSLRREYDSEKKREKTRYGGG